MRSSSRILALCSALIICVVLAACGGGGNTPPPPPGALTITTTVLSQGSINVPYSFYLMGTGGTGSYTWGVSSGSLPPGLHLNSTTAQIVGTPTAAGAFHFAAKVTDESSDTDTQDLTLNVSGAIVIKCNSCAANSSNLPSGTPGTLYSATLSASGGVAPYSWCVVEANNMGCDDGSGGALPDGLTINTSTGVISGTPTTPQAATQVTVQVQDSENPQSHGTTTITISIFGVTTTSLPSSQIYVPYNQAMMLAGGTKPYSWCAVESDGTCDNGSGGALPPGITLSASCTGTQSSSCNITGTPTGGGVFPFTLKVTDSEHPAVVATAQLSIEIAGIGNSLLTGNFLIALTGYKSGNPYVMAAAFVADGNGNITNGFLDLNDGSGETIDNHGNVIPQTLTTGSAYSLSPNGTGTITLVTSAETYKFSIVVSGTACTASQNKSSCGRIIQRDSANPQMYGSGVLKVQDKTYFQVNTFFPGSFALQAVGTNPSGGRYVAAGSLALNPSTLIDLNCVQWGLNDGCPIDQDNAGTAAYNPIKGSFSSTLDPMTGRGNFADFSFQSDPNGMCLGTIGSLHCVYAYYVVNRSEMILISANPISKPANLTLWTAFRQLSNAGGWTLSSLTGKSVAELNALNPNGGSPKADISAGILTSDGAGNASLKTDENDGGSLHLAQSSSGTYTIDSSGQKTGKVKFDGLSTQFGTKPPIVYLYGSNYGYLVGTDAKATSGFLEPQSGSPYSNTSVKGTYAGGSGAATQSAVTDSVTFMFADGVGILSGMQFTSGSSGPGGPSNLALTYHVDSTGRSILQQSGNTYGYLYVVSPTKFVLLPVGSEPTLGVFFSGLQ